MNHSNTHPPRFGSWLFGCLLPLEDSWAVLGDLEEEFYERVQAQGIRAARRWYHWQVFKSIPLFLQQAFYWSILMFKNYLLVAFRTLRKYKGYAALNILGLAIGLSCALLFLLFVAHEWRYDRFHVKADNIYRINTHIEATQNATQNQLAMSSTFVATYLNADFPEVEHVVRLRQWDPKLLHKGQYYDDNNFLFADAEFFEVFSFDLLAGDPQTALQNPYSVVLTASMAHTYFGEARAVGQSIVLNDSLTFTVTGIAADPPSYSHFTFDALLAHRTLETLAPPQTFDWVNFKRNYTYALLQDGANAQAFEEKIAQLPMERFGQTLEKVGLRSTLSIHPLAEVYASTAPVNRLGATGNQDHLFMFGVIAAFMLALAVINFINLSTARSVLRAREVGVRKVVGSSRSTLALQFLGEAMLTTAFAFVTALVLTQVSLPFFTALLDKPLAFDVLPVPTLVLASCVFVGGVGLLAGLYPALVLSRFKPVEVLKGTLKTSWHGIRLRQGLVIFQFAITVVLLVSTFIVWQQLRYMQAQNLGFDDEQVVVLTPPADQLAQHHQHIASTFEALPAVQAATVSDRVPGQGVGGGFIYPNPSNRDDLRGMRILAVDYDYLTTLGIETVAGRSFSESFTTDAQDAALINEAAAKQLGYATPDEAIGHVLIEASDMHALTVIGVLQDYHHVSLKEAISPQLLRIYPYRYEHLSLRLQAQDMRTTLAALETTWATLFPGYPFDYFFLDDAFAKQYASDQNVGQLVSLFAALAILVACFGLFGLAAFATLQRTKEVGIRKVLGASVPNLIALLARDFLSLVVLAIILAIPLALVAMERWLDDFAYRITLDWITFAFAGVLAIGVAFATVSYQAIKAAFMDPVHALRHE